MRVRVFAAFWQDLIWQTRTMQAIPCEEEGVPLVRRNSQGAAKACNRVRSALIRKMNIQEIQMQKHYKPLLIEISGQLLFLG